MPFELQKVTDCVYIVRNITNSSFVIGNRSVAVIDTQVNHPSARRVLAAVRSVTDKPIEYVINTHYHWDHTSGNVLFKNEGAAVISSKMTKEFMTARAPRQKEFLAGRGFNLGLDPLLPEVTFEGEYSIDLGDMPLRLFFAGRAETDDATAVHVVREQVVMSGDTVMTGSFPIFGQPVWDEGLEGTGQWQRTIQNLMSLKPVCIVPGHGPLAGQAEIDLLLRIENYFVDEVKALAAKGLTLGQILKDLEPRLPSWITEMPVVWGTPRYAILRVYRSLTRKESDPEPGWQRFKPSTIPHSPSSVVESKIGFKETFSDFIKMSHEAAEGGDAGLRLAILKKGTEVFPNLADSWTSYAEALIENSRREKSVLEKGDFFQAARDAWEKALALDPGHLGALLGKGRYFATMAFRGGDDPSYGIGLLEKVTESRPGGRFQAEAEACLAMIGQSV